MNIMMRKDNTAFCQKGAVLLFALLILIAITILLMTALRIGGFEQRMSAHFREQIMAFRYAESALAIARGQLFAGDAMNSHNTLPHASFDILPLEESACQKEYLVRAHGQFAKAKTRLEALYVVPTYAESCSIQPYQAWWRELSDSS